MESNLLKVLRGEPTPAVPVILTGAACAAKLAGSTLDAMRVDAEEMVRVQAEFQKANGMDWVVIYSDAYYLTEAMGCQVVSGDSGPVIKEPVDYELILQVGKVDFYTIPSCKVILDSIELAVAQTPDLPVGVLFEGPFTTATRMFGTEKMLMDLIMEPQKVVGCLEVITRVLIDFVAEAQKRGVSIIYVPDPMSSKNMISPAHNQEYAQPYQKQLFAYIKGLGLASILHVCGNTKDRWPQMAATGADALSLDQVVDFREVREALGPAVVIAGNVDPVGTLLRGEPEKVMAEAKQSFERGGPDNFILMPGCGTPPGTPAANMKALVQSAREFQK